jgi:hypothetical protein
MSCAIEATNHGQSAAIAVIDLTRYSNSVVTPGDCAGSTETADARTARERGRSKSTVEVFGDSEHANPDCIWGDEGPINN